MLGKLFKYEFRAVARTLVPLYLATLVLALVNGFAMRFDNSFFTGLMIFALTAFGIAIFVVTIVLIIQRFWNNLLKDEGYLMFTLPVSPYELIASKLLSALIWIILGAVVGVASMLVWFIPLNLDALAELFRNFGQFVRELARYLSEVDISVYSATIKLGIAMLLGMLTEIQMLYLSMAVGQLPAFSKHKAAASFVSFILINFICQKVTSLIANGVYDGIDYVVTLENFQHFMGVFGNMMDVSLNIGNLINLAALLLTFFATGWILKNKLNLE